MQLTVDRLGALSPIPSTLRSAAVSGVYVLCTSRDLNQRLRREFGDTAIEILDIPTFVSRLELALLARGAATTQNVRHGPVNYHDKELPSPYIDWALPSKIVFFKRLDDYGYQKEYRFAVGPPGSWDAENVSLELELRRSLPNGRIAVERYKVAPKERYVAVTPSAGIDLQSEGTHAELQIGDIRDICQVR
jgi:hypothetical protein